MISRVVYKNRQGRRLLTTLAVAALVSGTLVVGSTALAVHDEGVFELEGNAVAGNTGVGTGSDPANPQSQPAGGEDWDAVYAGSSTASATSFIEDTTSLGGLAGQGDSILSQNTKDIQLVEDWTWKQTTTTSVQDKADIEHAYSAQYVVDKTGSQCGTAAATEECTLLYFGADRYSNSGDTVMGFWFFKKKVDTLGPDGSGNGTFSGSHTARSVSGRGDILVVADFRAGGKAPSIQVYEWVDSGGSASTHLDQIGGADTPASCTQAPPEKNNGTPIPPVGANDNYCATANQYVVTSPWPFLAKDNSGGTSGDGGSDTTFGVAEFMEGGINMTALGLGDQCFSSFMAETRASHSVTSTLSDFALGTFGQCTTTLSTAASLNGSGTTIDNSATSANGTASSGTDTATLTIKGINTWGGTLDWYLCGPMASASAVCDNTGVKVTSHTVSDSSPASDFVSGSATLTSAGRYCWYTEFTPDTTTAAAGVDGATHAGTPGSGNLECFTVSPVTPSLSTTAGTSPVTFGSAVTDNATLSGAAKEPGTNGASATPGSASWPTINATDGAFAGSIDFTLKKANCTDNAVAYSGTTPTSFPISSSVTGNGSYGPVSFTPDAPGTYHWVATYNGPGTGGTAVNNNLPLTHNATCNDGNEDVVVQQIPTAISTSPFAYPQDSASIKSSVATDKLPAGGTVVFRLFDSAANCGAGAAVTEVGTGGLVYIETKTNVVPAGGQNEVTGITTNNTSFMIDSSKTGTYYWLVTYSTGDTAHTSRQSSCQETSQFTQVDDAYPGTLFTP